MSAYQKLLTAFLQAGYTLIPCYQTIHQSTDQGKWLTLRHDVDNFPGRALKMAALEHQLGIRSSYYFRFHPKVFHRKYIDAIQQWGHEIGYHYENLCQLKGNKQLALQQFRSHLQAFRTICPIQTISPHGSPLSRYNNQEMWEQDEYKSLGITLDVSKDINFDNTLYLTETGRSWNSPFNRRDRVAGGIKSNYRTTLEIIQALQTNQFPSPVMLNVHPQRWNDHWIPWYMEKWGQLQKNWVKYVFFQQKGTDR